MKFKKAKQAEVSGSLKLAAIVSFVAMLVVNFLAGSTTILGGVQTAAVSDNNPNLFAPAGFTFAIWGLIYLLLIGFLVRLLRLYAPKKSALKPAQMQRVGRLFVVSSLLNLSWLLAWQYQLLGLSVIIMFGLLITLGLINWQLAKVDFGRREYGLIQKPFSIYFGWISVATIANVTTWLVSIGWDQFGWSGGTWMVLMLLVGGLIAVLTSLKLRDPLYLLVFVWAYAGILFKHLSDQYLNGAYPSTIVALTILLAVFLSLSIQLGAKVWPQVLARQG